MMGADFVLTGSIKPVARGGGHQRDGQRSSGRRRYSDTEMAPASESFSDRRQGAGAQEGDVVLPLGRNKLYDLYRRLRVACQIDRPTLEMNSEKTTSSDPFAEVWAETRAFYVLRAPEIVASAEANPKQKMRDLPVVI